MERSAELLEKKMPSSYSSEDPERTVELEFLDRTIPIFDLDDLLRASAEVLGKGKLGSTYKASLESGAVVAVKRVKNMNGLSKKEFIQQMQLLGKIKHENLVKIISFYYSKVEKLIIYEFGPDGNLFDLLHGQFQDPFLSSDFYSVSEKFLTSENCGCQRAEELGEFL